MTTTNTSTINPRDLAQRLASPYRRGVALYGSDGSRNVVWGVGETDEEAEADAARQDDVPADLTTAEITPAALARVAAGAVGLDGNLDLRRELGIRWVIDIHVEVGDAATAAIEVNEQLTKRGMEALTAAELTAMAESTEAIDTLIDDLHQTSTLPTGETGGVLASYRAALRARLREWLEDQAGEREDVEEAAQIAAVEAAHAAATGGFDGPEWDILEDLAVLTETDEDDRADAWDRLQEDGTPTTYFAAGDPASDRYQRHRKRLADAIEERDTDALRELAAEERADIEAQAAEAEVEAEQAIQHARAGAWDEALKHARLAARIERNYGDAPTWGPFEAAVKAARERIA